MCVTMGSACPELEGEGSAYPGCEGEGSACPGCEGEGEAIVMCTFIPHPLLRVVVTLMRSLHTGTEGATVSCWTV